MQILEFYADFTCPFSYVAERALLPAVAEQCTVEVRWHPYELDPDVPPEGRRIPKQDAGRIWGSTRRLAERHGLPVSRHAPPTTPNTALVLAAAEAARDAGRLGAFRAAAFDAYFVHARDLSDPEVLAELAGGLDYRAERWRSMVRETRVAANARGVSAVPAFVLGDRILHGIREADDLLDFLERGT